MSDFDFLWDGLKYALLVGGFWWIGRRLLWRYQRFTFPRTNTPTGRWTDWRGFFGRDGS